MKENGKSLIEEVAELRRSLVRIMELHQEIGPRARIQYVAGVLTCHACGSKASNLRDTFTLHTPECPVSLFCSITDLQRKMLKDLERLQNELQETALAGGAPWTPESVRGGISWRKYAAARPLSGVEKEPREEAEGHGED